MTQLPAAREAFAIWALAFGALAATSLVLPSLAVVAATVGFLYLPLWAMDKRHEDYRDYGVTLARWRQDLTLFLAVSGCVFPLFIAGYFAFVRLVPELPPSLGMLLAPTAYRAAPPSFSLRLPVDFPQWVIHHAFVVALPEEFFYRGFIQTRLRDAWPQGPRFFGARLGPAFWWTAMLFALGHLAIFQVWRLGVFFPALVFGWMRERTGTVVSAAAFHAASNLLMLVLEASFYGPR